ncbi:MAG TPA: YifB family Mg chelatase-like AAA ATPase [Thermoanaerobaculia bacterium]|nr:YifB family Mg chelatase-like AAA ATPase [Thermoanaerobaculia bacterium]
MLARATAATPWGIDARPVQVEVDVRFGLPGVQIVGLPDAAVRESRERVQAAIRNCGVELPHRAVVVNLAPADLRKAGNHLDLAIALALLVAHEFLQQEVLAGRLLAGELALDGTLRPVRGALAIADLARREDATELLLPRANAGEAAALEAVPTVGVASLAEALAHLRGEATLSPAGVAEPPAAGGEAIPDLADVRGQETARRTLEIAAAGGHNLLFIGPPGCGKTMLARRLPGILPPLGRHEAVAVTKIHSLVAETPPSSLLRERPFRSPHPGTSTAGMVGGGAGVPRPGEASMAHCGVLFLDELPEFRRDALESLRQPLEEGRVTIVRSRAAFTFPARFALLAAMNPCPCGFLGDPRRECTCPPPAVERYRGRISGPLLDRIDLQVEVAPVGLSELSRGPGEPTAAVAARVTEARERQRRRFGVAEPAKRRVRRPARGGLRLLEAGDGNPRGTASMGAGPISAVNATLGPEALAEHCPLDAAGRRLLDTAYERLGLSARAVHRVLKVARTIADLAAADQIGAAHVAEAIQYRTLDRKVEP